MHPSAPRTVVYMTGKCVREQIPLRLAWATTIHKSQGATIDWLLVDTTGSFENGATLALASFRLPRALR